MKIVLRRLFFLFAVGAVTTWLGCSDDDNGTNSNGNHDPDNHPPEIDSVTADPDSFYGNFTRVTVHAQDDDGDSLQYDWEYSESWLKPITPPFGNEVDLYACCPATEVMSAYVISLVTDGRGGHATDSVQLWLLPGGGK